jgi:Tol biopolymer transport system component
LLALAAGVAILAAALSPPGHAVWGSIRDAVGNEDHLLRLPAQGRVLVNTADGVWVVNRDGSKRYLSGYSDAAWSPHGLYVAAVKGDELVAMEPNGKVHWKLARRGVLHAPQWSSEGFRIAYFAGGTLRVVNGDGTEDRLLTRDVRPFASAWEPGTHSLAYVTRAGNIAVRNVDRARSPAYIRTRLSPRQLHWTPDRRLVAAGPHAIATFGRRGPQLSRIETAGSVTAAAPSPDGRRIALVETKDGQGMVVVNGEQIFKGPGSIAGAAWSPDGRWLLLNWTGANEWLFIRSSSGVRKIVAASNIRATFGMDPALAGWCCP